MCTAIKWNNFFGRTLDFEYGFGEETVIVPRNYPFIFRNMQPIKSHPAIIGMAKVADGYPLFFDGANEYGVAIAGLNFEGNAYFPNADDGSIASFEFIPYLLCVLKSAKDALCVLSDKKISNIAFSSSLKPSPLHWMIADKDNCFTVESTSEGLKIYENTVGVLTNNPPFPYQMMNLSNYINVTAEPVENRFSQKLELRKISRGMGGIGLPGDSSSQSRFVRAAFVRENARGESVSDFFHVITSVEQINGCVRLESDEQEFTRYTSCIDLEKGVYYYTTYSNRRINALNINSAKPDNDKVFVYPLCQAEDINNI